MDKLLPPIRFDRAVHLCVDMQRLFSDDGPWPTPWMPRVLPNCAALAALNPARTIFTRFIPPRAVEEAHGSWLRYYERWSEATRERLDATLIELMPELARYVPPATVFDKPVYSAFAGRRLSAALAERDVETLIVSGAETDVCVLSTILGAIDLGFFIIVVRDAVCSSSDEGHDALISMFECRYSQQLAITDTQTILAAWMCAKS
ncbi:MAG TPA: isochorismatase family cysteine hydrolase [Ensifer sp.]|uniref:cysteine hydrolase family protein n=1 Tax=Ensifer sp. TaxID=1872086 RepID=UPI002E15E32F|nr:isochorismatase family cysteine hydrolase [Ensifer sp.]